MGRGVQRLQKEHKVFFLKVRFISILEMKFFFSLMLIHHKSYRYDKGL